jgi:hypothetical protein
MKLPVGRFTKSPSVWCNNDKHETRWYVLKGDSTKRSTYCRPYPVYTYLAWPNYLIPILQRLPRRDKQHRHQHPPLLSPIGHAVHTPAWCVMYHIVHILLTVVKTLTSNGPYARLIHHSLARTTKSRKMCALHIIRFDRYDSSHSVKHFYTMKADYVTNHDHKLSITCALLRVYNTL